jgi:hypothetical protein
MKQKKLFEGDKNKNKMKKEIKMKKMIIKINKKGKFMEKMIKIVLKIVIKL